MSALHDEIRSFILARFLPGEKPENLTDDTPLVTNGVLDSLATLMLVAHLEETYGIDVAAHEASVDNLGTIDQIARLVESKRGAGGS